MQLSHRTFLNSPFSRSAILARLAQAQTESAGESFPTIKEAEGAMFFEIGRYFAINQWKCRLWSYEHRGCDRRSILHRFLTVPLVVLFDRIDVRLRGGDAQIRLGIGRRSDFTARQNRSSWGPANRVPELL